VRQSAALDIPVPCRLGSRRYSRLAGLAGLKKMLLEKGRKRAKKGEKGRKPIDIKWGKWGLSSGFQFRFLPDSWQCAQGRARHSAPAAGVGRVGRSTCPRQFLC